MRRVFTILFAAWLQCVAWNARRRERRARAAIQRIDQAVARALEHRAAFDLEASALRRAADRAQRMLRIGGWA